MSDARENGRMLMEVGAVFHEQQRLLLCGVHCLNALFCNQIPARHGAAGMPPLYSKVRGGCYACGGDVRVDTRLALAYQGSLDQIAEERHRAARELGIAGGFLNPHKSSLGLGNYDVVVMESAVQAQGCQWQVVRRCVRACVCEHVRVGMSHTHTHTHSGSIRGRGLRRLTCQPPSLWSSSSMSQRLDYSASTNPITGYLLYFCFTYCTSLVNPNP